MATVSKIDEQGRVMIPLEIRKELHLNENDKVTIEVMCGGMLIKRARPCCLVCKKTYFLIENLGRSLCLDCLDAYNSMVK